tara:strand:- start:2989 stop:3291 length:303 start_codon:yes stop_codon:yes gene_type:complete
MKKNNLLCDSCKAGIMCMCDRKKPEKITKKESVNHPEHYLKNTGHEVIDVINAWKLNFELGNAIKYIARAGKKDPNKEIEDLEKAMCYIEMQIKSIKNNI